MLLRLLRANGTLYSGKVRYTEDEQRIFDATGDIWLAVILASLLGVTGLVLWSVSYGYLTSASPISTAVQTLGIYSLVACAASGAGSLFGFLFGIPRTREAERVASRSDDPGSMRQAVLAANTNLERVSDWLTTLLLGATLVQLHDIVKWVGDLGENIQTNPDKTVTTVLVVYFVVVGFLGTYLVTRLYLTYALQRMLLAPPAPVGLRQQLEDALRLGDKDRLDQALTALQEQGPAPDDAEISLLIARATSKRIGLGSIDPDRKRTLEADLLAAWKKAMANADVKTRVKSDEAVRREFQDLDDDLKTQINKELD
jgi:hypothetical protein